MYERPVLYVIRPTYSMLLIQYMYKISCKMDKIFLRYSMFFHRGSTRPSPALRFSKKPSPGKVKGPMWCCAWQSWIFWKYLKKGFYDFIGKSSHYFFLNLAYNESLFYLLYSCTNPIFGGKSGSWDMGQNALGHLDCRIFVSTISLEQCEEKVWFFACWYKFIKITN